MPVWQILLIAAGVIVLLYMIVAVYFFQFTILRKKEETFGPKNDTGTNWDQYVGFIREAKQWFTDQNGEEITVEAADGLHLRGVYIPAAVPAQTLVFCVHGYKSQGINDYAALSRFYHGLGCDVLVVDDRAHGKSEGRYIGFGCLDRLDCRAWLQYVAERFGDSRHVFLHGISMGAATVLMASGVNLAGDIRGIVADCGFTSAWNVFAHILRRDYHMPPFPLMHLTSLLCRLFAGYGFKDVSTVDAVAGTDLPILFIHGGEDNFVPTRMSRENYEACNSEKQLLIVEKAGHAESYYADRSAYEDAVQAFLKRHGAALSKSNEEITGEV